MNQLVLPIIAAVVLGVLFCLPLYIVVKHVVYANDPKRKVEDAVRIQQAHEANQTTIRLDEIRRSK